MPLRYALEAKRMAGRSEHRAGGAVGVVAYQNGDYELAVKELRAARRISGLDTLVPLIADCERALASPRRRWRWRMRSCSWIEPIGWSCGSWRPAHVDLESTRGGAARCSRSTP